MHPAQHKRQRLPQLLMHLSYAARMLAAVQLQESSTASQHHSSAQLTSLIITAKQLMTP